MRRTDGPDLFLSKPHMGCTFATTDRAPSFIEVRSSYQKLSQRGQSIDPFIRATVAEVVTAERRSSQVFGGTIDWLRFSEFVRQWKADTAFLSSATETALHPAYQSIIGMGDIAVRFLLKQLASEGDQPDHWFWALRAITGANPVDPRDAGDNVAMARAWHEWGLKNGYVW